MAILSAFYSDGDTFTNEGLRFGAYMVFDGFRVYHEVPSLARQEPTRMCLSCLSSPFPFSPPRSSSCVSNGGGRGELFILYLSLSPPLPSPPFPSSLPPFLPASLSPFLSSFAHSPFRFSPLCMFDLIFVFIFVSLSLFRRFPYSFSSCLFLPPVLLPLSLRRSKDDSQGRRQGSKREDTRNGEIIEKAKRRT